ncbi:hypothetical protein SAMN05444395_105192 [Flavobacterium fryxellicola]|nr:hypothetical protein [Flavobacterium fryxellicola]SHN70330.1 hypothetical protein SAMN05444395_105192 [Flavobacterium fryxellicola]
MPSHKQDGIFRLILFRYEMMIISAVIEFLAGIRMIKITIGVGLFW